MIKTDFINDACGAELHVAPGHGSNAVYLHRGPPPNPSCPGALALVCMDADAADALAAELKAAAAAARRDARIGVLHLQLAMALDSPPKALAPARKIGRELVALGGRGLRDGIGTLAARGCLGRAAVLVKAWGL